MDNTFLTLNNSSKEQWLSYWHQISEALEISPERVLVVGKGSGITEHSITQISDSKTVVLTLDINNAVNSDIVGSVTELPFRTGSFDVIICCQVLEHISFDKFPASLGELYRVAGRRVVLSLPHKRKYFKITFNIPFLKEGTFIIKHPLTTRHCSSKQHYWEIGRGVSRRSISMRSMKTQVFHTEEKRFLTPNHFLG